MIETNCIAVQNQWILALWIADSFSLSNNHGMIQNSALSLLLTLKVTYSEIPFAQNAQQICIHRGITSHSDVKTVHLQWGIISSIFSSKDTSLYSSNERRLSPLAVTIAAECFSSVGQSLEGNDTPTHTISCASERRTQNLLENLLEDSHSRISPIYFSIFFTNKFFLLMLWSRSIPPYQPGANLLLRY